MFVRNRTLFLSPDAAGGAPAPAVAAPVTPEAAAPEADDSTEDEAEVPAPVTPEVKGKKKPAAKAPEAPVTPTPPSNPENKDLKELIAAHAKAENLAEELKTEKASRAADAARLDVYRAHAMKSAQKAIESAPDFVRDRIKLDESDPIKTIGEVETLLEIYEAAKKNLGVSTASAPPPSTGGSNAHAPVSVWTPAGPLPRGRRK